MKKKITIKEFNEKEFPDWRKIKRVIPHFEKWYPGGDACDEEECAQQVISRIDIVFENGEKLSIVPFSNKDDGLDEEICSALKIVEYKAEEVVWKNE